MNGSTDGPCIHAAQDKFSFLLMVIITNFHAYVACTKYYQLKVVTLFS